MPYSKEYLELNREKINEKVRIQMKERYQNNPEVREAKRQYYLKKKEEKMRKEEEKLI